MSIFVDASAMVAIIRGEADANRLMAILEGDPVRLISGLALWESVRAVAKASQGGISEAWRLCEAFRTGFGIELVPIAEPEATAAIEAHVRYGKGTGHPAQLNMGDCFAYACARTNRARLLYKGDDFSHTDLA